MTVRSNLLTMDNSGAGTTGTKYTVPAGTRAIAKSLIAWNSNAAYNILQFNVMNGATLEGLVIFELGPTGALGAVIVKEFFWVILEGRHLTLTVAHSSIYWELSGAELAL